MMKIKATLGGRETLIIGLSHANLDKLRADGLTAKILIDGKELGIPIDVWITAAEDEGVMMRAFQEGITEGTKVHIDKRFKS
jgi:hypothetical protein